MFSRAPILGKELPRPELKRNFTAVAVRRPNQMGVPWELLILNSSTMQGERGRNVFQLRGEPTVCSPSSVIELAMALRHYLVRQRSILGISAI